jgi:DNA-binding MarR family transcriptional regulator/GNAT superfamily N-acetyltransferase
MSTKQLPQSTIDRLRAFNRFWTARLGVLGPNLHETPYSLGEARVIFELAQQPSLAVSELREKLALDAGYLSRILAGFKRRKLVQVEKSRADVRRHIVKLTAAGKAAFHTLDKRASKEVGELIEPLSQEDRARLLGALEKAHELLETSRKKSQSYVIRPLRAGDLGWVVSKHGVLYAQEYGWDTTFEAFVARIVADYGEHRDPKRDNAWMAEAFGEPVGCIFCIKKDAKTAQLRMLIVDPKARGLGIGGRLIEECLRFAKDAGYSKMVLWTNDILHSARRLYQKAGFELVEEEKHHSFGLDLVGQFWSRKL